MINSGNDPMRNRTQRLEVFTDAGKRRQLSARAKFSIVAECYPVCEGVSAVALRHGLKPSRVYAWRRDFRKHLECEGLALSAPVPEVTALSLPPSSCRRGTSRHQRQRRPRKRRSSKANAVDLQIDSVAMKVISPLAGPNSDGWQDIFAIAVHAPSKLR